MIFQKSFIALLAFAIAATTLQPLHADNHSFDDLVKVDRLIFEAEQAQKSNKFDQALEASKNAVAFIESLPTERQLLLPKALHIYGDALFRLGKSSDAVSIHERAVKILEDARAPSLSMSASYEYLAAALFDCGRSPESLVALEKAINPRLNENIGDFYYVYRLEALRASILSELGQSQKAKEHFEFAIKGLRLRPTDPNYILLPRSLVTYATLLLEMGTTSEAEKLVEEATTIAAKIKLEPATQIYSDILLVRAKLAFNKTDHGTAVELATKAYATSAAALGASHPHTLYKLSMAYAYQNEAGLAVPDRAVLDRDLVLVNAGISDTDSRKPEALGVFARALANQARNDEAAQLYQKALDLDKPFSDQRDQRVSPERIILLNNLSHIEYQLDRYDEAEALMQ